MILTLVVALLFGIVAGLRTLMAPAIYFLVRGPLTAGIVFAVLEIGELIGDKLPLTPARTRSLPLIGRVLMGAIVGWFVGTPTGMPIPCAALGFAGALIGTFGGYALRARAIAKLGPLPAAFLEDVAAAVLGIVAVTR